MGEKVNRRQTIHHVAAKLFFTKGYHATSMREIARAVNVEQAALYHYYPGKQSLLYEIIKQGIQDLSASVNAELESAENTTDKIRIFLSMLVRYVIEQREEAGMSPEIRNLDPDQRKELRQINMEFIDKFRRLLNKGVREKVIRPCNTKFAAVLCLSSATNIAQWYNPDGPLTVDEIAKIFADQILLGLLRTK